MATEPRSLGVGFIGIGIAGSIMIQTIRSNPKINIAGAADVRQDLLDAFSRDFEVETYTDVNALCANPNVEAVYIGTPHQFHREHVVTAAKHGKHIIVEKPLALTLEDCDEIIKAVDETGVKLIVGHTHSYDPPIGKMREIIRSGELGRLGMINTWNYTNFLYRPRRPEELDTRLGGGIIFNQVPHQVDTIRLLAGGMAKSVKAVTGVWDKERPTEGSYLAYLDFEGGAAASMVYNGYDHFDTDEFHYWIGENGENKVGSALTSTGTPAGSHGRLRTALGEVKTAEDEKALRLMAGWGGERAPGRHDSSTSNEPHFGITIVSCEQGDMRPSENGVFLFTKDGKNEVPIDGSRTAGRGEVLDELYNAVIHNEPLIHDARWGKATLEVCLGILRSSREGKEIALSHQVPDVR